MKKSIIELEIYSQRRYYFNKYYNHRIKAIYWFLKYKYYKKRHLQQFNK